MVNKSLESSINVFLTVHVPAIVKTLERIAVALERQNEIGAAALDITAEWTENPFIHEETDECEKHFQS